MNTDFYFFILDEEQLDKYLLHSLQNKMSEKSNTSELQETQTCPQFSYEEPLGFEDGHYGNYNNDM